VQVPPNLEFSRSFNQLTHLVVPGHTDQLGLPSLDEVLVVKDREGCWITRMAQVKTGLGRAVVVQPIYSVALERCVGSRWESCAFARCTMSCPSGCSHFAAAVSAVKSDSNTAAHFHRTVFSADG
jgi:hypothetical protein